MVWRPNRKHKNPPSSPIGKIGIDDFNAGGKGLGKGSHQEVSFSVLHAKSSAADPANSTSPSTVTRPVWDSSSEEVQNKKRQRMRSRRLAITAVASVTVACVVAISAVAFLNYQHSLDYVGRMQECLRQVVALTEELQPLESLMSDMLSKPLDEQSAANASSKWEEVKGSLQPMQKRLEETKSQIEELQPHLTPVDVEVCNQALTAINAQLNIIDLSSNIMDDYVVPAATTYSDSQTFMEQLLEADSFARAASQLLESPTIDKAQESISNSNASLNLFSKAKQNLQNIKSVCEKIVEDTTANGNNSELKAKVPPTVTATGSTLPTILLDPYFEYIDLRMQAQNLAIAGDNAYIDRDKATVISTTDSYNALEIRAAALISQSSADPSQVVQATYDDRCFADSETFNSEHSRAKVAITAIRTYLS